MTMNTRFLTSWRSGVLRPNKHRGDRSSNTGQSWNGAIKAILISIAISPGVMPVWGQDRPPPRDESENREPPAQAYADCRGRRVGDAVLHKTREGTVSATCADSPKGLVARPNRNADTARELTNDTGRKPQPEASQDHQGDGRRYSLAQAMSDRAQLNTIAFDGLAFLTGDFGHDTFLPPGKVSDYFGFQYMRDIDAREAGHNTSFLTRIAHNMLSILDDGQRAKLLALAKQQQVDIRRFAEMRLPLIMAFRLNLEGKLPVGSSGLDPRAVREYSADLYALDGKLSFERAKVMADVLRSLSPSQKAALARLKFGDSGTWPEVPEPLDRRSMSHDINVAVMTYASEMFSWQAGSLDADTYFCPERHGMYFGGFGMKTAPAMGKRDYSISTTLTGNGGEAFLAVLTDTQRNLVTSLVDQQRSDLGEIAHVRREIASELRRLLRGEVADQSKVIALSKRYGELDGNLSYLYANVFARVVQSLTQQQRSSLNSLRRDDPSGQKGPFLYSTPVATPQIAGVSQLFGVRK